MFCASALAMLCWTACFPDDYLDEINKGNQPVVNPGTGEEGGEGTDPGTDPGEDPGEDPGTDPGTDPGDDSQLSYDNLAAYDVLKNYVDRTISPDFKMGGAVYASDFVRKTGVDYALAVANLDEVTAGNAMKQASVMRPDGSMDFTTVRNFINTAAQEGLTVYGHTLAWHSQQQNQYLRSLIAGKKVEVPDGNGEVIILERNFNDGSHPFNGWGNNSTRTVENGAFKVTNPSAVNDWEAQFAYDVAEPFENGKEYVLSFRIKGTGSGTLSAGFQITDGYKSAGEFPGAQFNTQWQNVEMKCMCNADGATRLVFSFGKFVGDIYIDDFCFKATGMNYEYVEMTPQEKKDALTDAMDRWIKGMMEATATKVSAWDAVNESISGRDTNGDSFYELESASWGSSDNFYWQDYLGSEDYVRIVIDLARKYYAEYGGTKPLKLFINDYNLESDWDDNRKLKSLIHWIGVWESDGVTRIDGIGTQMHISYYENQGTQKSKEDHIVKMLQLMANTGKLVKISELDMGYIDINGNTVPTTRIQDYQLRKMADYYAFIVRKYFEIIPPAQQYGITQWCLCDAPGELGTGWRGGEPVGLWDRNGNRKYAYAGFANGLMGK